jgi:hypothetical protein
MTLRLAKLLLLSLFPVAGLAQSLPTITPTANAAATPLVDQLLGLTASGEPMLAQGAPVLPIWSSSNGQLLAVVALPREWSGTLTDATPAYGGPSAWHLAGSAPPTASGLRWQLGSGFHGDAMLGQYLSPAGTSCAAAGCNTANSTRWSHGSLATSLGMGWTSAGGGLDLSYGLSWLQSQGSAPSLADFALGGSSVPVLTLPGSPDFSLDSEASMYARGRWQFSAGPAVDLAASYGRTRLSSVDAVGSMAPGIDLDQLSLSLGLDSGSLRGAIVGHVIRSDDPLLAGRHWTTLDLGVSWRTPWAGELSVGAQNLLNTPLNSSRDADSPQSRTPYIQYRQDL